jgi:hypothetical protein
MALVSTQPLTEMSTRNLPGCKERPVHKADNLTAIIEPIVYKMWEPRRLTSLWSSTACYKDSFNGLYNEPDTVKLIKIGRLRCLGYVFRMQV